MLKTSKVLSLLLTLLLLLTSCDLSSVLPDQDGSVKPDSTCTEHLDAEDNGLCDVCNISLFVSIDFSAPRSKMSSLDY